MLQEQLEQILKIFTLQTHSLLGGDLLSVLSPSSTQHTSPLPTDLSISKGKTFYRTCLGHFMKGMH